MNAHVAIRNVGRAARRATSNRRLVMVGALAAGAVLLAHPAALGASDVFSNVGPASQVPGGSLIDAYPLGNYTLDHHFSAVDAGVFSGVDASGVAPTIAWFLASVLWLLTSFLAHAAITLFTFAFSLDLLNGGGTGGTGALAPVSDAVRSIYRTMFGEAWLIVAITLTGLWAMWHALVRGRYTETAGALGLSVVFVVIALAFVSQPERTIGEASRWTNAMSGAFLSLSSEGNVTSQARAKRDAADQLFALLVYEPWVVLQFGGREHCVRADDGDDPASMAVRPLSRDPATDAALSRRLARSDEVRADGKVCVNNRNKYAPRFLKYGPGSDERDQHHDALKEGDTAKAPEQDRQGYRLSSADKPAADAMGQDGQYQRLLLAVVIFGGQLGAIALLGALSVAVILAQVVVLLLLAFAPVALVIGVFPGAGHDFFRQWLTKLAAFLLRKAIYSLILAVLLTVVAAVGDATANLGWLMGWGLQGAFFWAVLIWRKQLLGQLTRATTGQPGDQGGGLGRFASGYAVAHMAGRFWRRHRPGGGGPPAPPASDRPRPGGSTTATTLPVIAPTGDQPARDRATAGTEPPRQERSPDSPTADADSTGDRRAPAPRDRQRPDADPAATPSDRPSRPSRQADPSGAVSPPDDADPAEPESALRSGLRGDRQRLHREPHPVALPPGPPAPPEPPADPDDRPKGGGSR
jgi:hypothetical protein